MANLSFTPIVVDNGTGFTPPSSNNAPVVPRFFNPKLEEQHISFVIEIAGNTSNDAVKRLKSKINTALCTELSGYFPELLYSPKNIFDLHRLWKATKKKPKDIFFKKEEIKKIFDDIKIKKLPELPFTLERLFPDAENDYKSAKLFGLDTFLILTLPIFERQFLRRTSKEKYQASLYEVAYTLDKIKEIISVTPTNRYNNQLFSSSSSSGTNPLPHNWMLTNMQANSIPAGVSGGGVVIGHPDSGWTPHSQLNFTNVNINPISPSFDLNRDWNVFNDTNTAEESLATNAITKFHGTATSSIIISRNDTLLTGLAPGATILPIRTIAELGSTGIDTGVVLIGDTDVARAVWYCIQKGVDVISLSVGGYPMPALECVIAHAVYNDIIVVAAAGQYWPFLVFPAGYPECIAVGASNNDNRPWSDCVKSEKIAISAPGEGVFHADWDDRTPNRRESVISGNGCSYATAYVAGAAALWLNRYNKQNLINGLGGRATLQELFLAHIQRTATLPFNWNTSESGAGIINIRNLMDTSTLPDFNSFVRRDWNNWVRRSSLELLYMMYENTDPVVVRERLQRLFNSDNIEEFLRKFGQEVFETVMRVRDVAEKIGEGIENTIEEAEEKFEEVVDDVKDFLSDAATTVTGWLPW